jgi:hypothetical protein
MRSGSSGRPTKLIVLLTFALLLLGLSLAGALGALDSLGVFGVTGASDTDGVLRAIGGGFAP